MRIFSSFMMVGLICMIASLIYDLTKLTPGHITSLFVVFGGLLGVFDFYDLLIKKFGYGLALPITSFGNSLVNAAYHGFRNNGILGLLGDIYSTTSIGISGAIIVGFIITLFCKAKD